MGFIITDQCRRANMLPTWRTLHLNHIKQLRMMIRDRRQVEEAKRCLKDAQRSAAYARRKWFNASDANTITFMDGYSVSVGDVVEVSTRYGTDGQGVVIAVDQARDKVKVDLDPAVTRFGQFDNYPVKTGGHFDRARDHGLNGGEIVGTIRNLRGEKVERAVMWPLRNCDQREVIHA